MEYEIFFEWEVSVEGRAHYASHPDQPGSQTMRMLVAFQHMQQHQQAPSRGYTLVNYHVHKVLYNLVLGSNGHDMAISYFMSLLNTDELDELECRAYNSRPVSEDRAMVTAFVREHVARTKEKENEKDDKGVTLAQGKAPYWTPSEYEEWCASDEGVTFYWLVRRDKFGGPTDLVGDPDPPERIRSDLSSLREHYSVTDANFRSQLFSFLHRHEPHVNTPSYPQTFLYAVSLLTPHELSLAKKAVHGCFALPNPHPNAVTMRHLHSLEAAKYVGSCHAQKRKRAIEEDTGEGGVPVHSGESSTPSKRSKE